MADTRQEKRILATLVRQPNEPEGSEFNVAFRDEWYLRRFLKQ